MNTNPVKTILKAGGTAVGSEVSRFRSADIPRIYAAAGCDFVFIDMEHSSFSLETVADMIESARRSNIVPIVRVPQAEYAFVARVLDCGAQGIIVPRVNTPEQVEQIVSWVRYPPAGIRGFACNTAQTDGQPVSAESFIQTANRETLLAIQIERREAVANLEAMLSIEGVDVACLGFMALAVDLGIPGQLDHPTAVAAVQRMVDVANDNGVAPGIIAADMNVVTEWMSRGMRFVSFATDEILLQRSVTESIGQLRRSGEEAAAEQPLSQLQ